MEGLALHLDPSVLEAEGGVYSTPRELRIEGDHYFVCVACDADRGNWVPLYSHCGHRRLEIPHEHKRGHAGWVDKTSFYRVEQVWYAPHEAVIEAAEAGGDLSRPGARNTVTEEGLSAVFASLEWPEQDP